MIAYLLGKLNESVESARPTAEPVAPPSPASPPPTPETLLKSMQKQASARFCNLEFSQALDIANDGLRKVPASSATRAQREELLDYRLVILLRMNCPDETRRAIDALLADGGDAVPHLLSRSIRPLVHLGGEDDVGRARELVDELLRMRRVGVADAVDMSAGEVSTLVEMVKRATMEPLAKNNPLVFGMMAPPPPRAPARPTFSSPSEALHAAHMAKMLASGGSRPPPAASVGFPTDPSDPRLGQFTDEDGSPVALLPPTASGKRGVTLTRGPYAYCAHGREHCHHCQLDERLGNALVAL
jgi:hypothetical protein